MNRYFGLHTLEGEWHALLPRYLLLADRVEGRRVLDIGSGSGIGASMLLELGAEMVDATDHRPEVLEIARMKHAKDGLDFHVMFWEELDFPDDTFDVVVCLDPSSPVTDPSLIQEVRRVLKDGGEYICAIERKPLHGIEELLPRYGYNDSAENVDINDAQERVPQIGELQKHFARVTSIVQRPLLAYVFDRDDGGASSRREGPEGGVWIEDDEADDEGRWLSVDNRLSSNEDDPGSVEIWFCGDAELADAPLKEVRLPYYGITERLQQVMGDLQVRGVSDLGEEDSLFEEVLDSPPSEPSNDPLDERYDVTSFAGAGFESEPTTIHASALPPAQPAPTGQFHEELAELRALYGQMHTDFQGMMAQAQTALAERDGYIQHLVQQVQMWQQRYAGAATGSGSIDDSTTTGVFKKLDTPRGAGHGDLEAEVARLRDAQRRMAAELEQKNAYLRATGDAEDTSERDAISPESVEGEKPQSEGDPSEPELPDHDEAPPADAPDESTDDVVEPAEGTGEEE